MNDVANFDHQVADDTVDWCGDVIFFKAFLGILKDCLNPFEVGFCLGDILFCKGDCELGFCQARLCLVKGRNISTQRDVPLKLFFGVGLVRGKLVNAFFAVLAKPLRFFRLLDGSFGRIKVCAFGEIKPNLCIFELGSCGFNV